MGNCIHIYPHILKEIIVRANAYRERHSRAYVYTYINTYTHASMCTLHINIFADKQTDIYIQTYKLLYL